MSTTVSENVLHAIDEGVGKMRREYAEAVQRTRQLEQDLATEKARFVRVASEDEARRTTVTDLRSELAKSQQEAGRLREALDARKAANDTSLDRYDRITLDLYHYIVELAGHRDTAKTKAERVAIGHVVERLAEIRGMTDAEREAIA